MTGLLLSMPVGILGAFIGFKICNPPGAAWWVGVITAALVLLTQNLIK